MLIFFATFLAPAAMHAQQISETMNKKYKAVKIDDHHRFEIDGELKEECWQKGDWATDFVQREPNENAPPMEQTAFKILYDSKFLYVGIKNYDRHPASINRRMSRRDGSEGDWVELILDSDRDLRTAFAFVVTAAGVKGDKLLSQNGEIEDDSWNPIWYTNSQITEEGWVAEMKIPFSQLRFGKEQNQNWGLQLRRKYFRHNSISVWQRIPLDVAGWISEFGQLTGLTNLKSRKQIEIQPYVVFGLTPSNELRTSLGVDGKISISNDLTLDFAANPDFGQVEADPAAIALDGFQLFFEEQRPFFVENKNIFDYRFSTSTIGSIYNNDNLFYSRRIGGKPHGLVTNANAESVDIPDRTTILGALKFSGKTQQGLSVGILESVTANEYAKITQGSETQRIIVEPWTNYFVGRVQQDFNHQNTFLGAMLTNTRRQLPRHLEAILHKSATTAGTDLFHQWKNRSWYLGANLVFSQVEGTSEAILVTQQSVKHLFQRVDAKHVQVDSSKTSLLGSGGNLKLGKAGDGRLLFETGLTWRSPELELNDIGFMREADIIQNHLGITYRSLKPFGKFRNAAVNYKHWIHGDFAGNINYVDWDVEISGTFQNNWLARFGFFSQPHIYSKSLLQGGPRIFLPDQFGFWWGVTTDARKKLSIQLDGWTKNGDSDAYYLFESGLDIRYQPSNRLYFSLSPRYNTTRHRLMFVEGVQFKQNPHFIAAHLDQKTFSLSLRLNYTFTPNLSLQYYGQPFVSSGRYRGFGRIIQPLAKRQREQMIFFDHSQMMKKTDSGSYQVDEDQDGIMDYQFRDPDFSFFQFRSNLVLRFEYKPGSEIFLVWAQSLDDYANQRLSISESLQTRLLRGMPENNFLVKMTFRFL